MDNSFYNWYQPTQSRYPSTISQPKSTTYSKPSPKIVSIPVQFVRSESTRSESTLKIQKVFRGFMARRKVKQISDLKRQVDEVEAMISNSVEILRIGDKERLRVNEVLMSLLLKLDSVHGTVVPGIRDYRKAVIKKAIALQEKIDAIVNATQTLERKDSIEEEKETVKDDDSIGGIEEEEERVKDDSIGEGICCNCDEKSSESSVTFVEPVQSSSTAAAGEEEEEGDCKNKTWEKGNKEEEAEMKNWERKMVMGKLLESNEIQMRMIRLLTERVDQLERALLCEKLKKKKQKNKKKGMRGGDRWELRSY